MKNILYIIILNLCFAKNFIYTEDSWYSVLSPRNITSISCNHNEIFFSSTNGLFIYNKDNKDFYYSDYILGNLDNKKIHIIHYDLYRDNIWALNNEYLLFKSNLSNVWTRLNFYDFDINLRTIKNIGSNSNFIIIKISNYEYVFLDPYTGLVQKELDDDIIEMELLSVVWSASSRQSFNSNLNDYYAFGDIEIISNNQIKSNNRNLYITCVLDDMYGEKWIGTNSGELFFINQYSDEIEKIKSIPSILNMNVAYLDSNQGWWITDNELISDYSDIFYNQEPVFLYHWNEQINLWTKYYQKRYPGIFSKDINDIHRIEDTLYLATDYGLLVYQIKNNKWILLDISSGLPSNIIYKLAYYNDMLYLATESGLATVSVKTNNLIDVYFYALNNGKIFDINFLDKYLYILNNNGLIKMNVETEDYSILLNKKFEKIDIKNDNIVLMKNNNLYLLKNDYELELLVNYQRAQDFDICNDYLWIHSHTDALIYNMKSNYKLEYDSSDGILLGKINRVECDEDWVWFSTSNGISFYNWGKYHYEE